jgi:general secretion pathway protein I
MINKQKGFTLLEVMIAITIFAMLASTISQVAAVTVDSQLHLEKKLLATWIAENDIITMRTLPWGQIKSSREELKYSHREWLVKREVKDKKKFGGVPLPVEVREITVSVYLKSEPDNSLQSFIAYMANDDIE